MQLTDFLRTVLPTSGLYYTVQISNTGKPQQFKHKSIEEAAQSIEKINARHHNAFFATGTFKDKRTQDDCVEKRAWYVDIDCKPGKEYDSKALAREALKDALKAGLPKPSIMVDSGNGYHLYWVVTEAVTKAQWNEWAPAIENACAVTGLKIDPTSTKDAARILRAPETLNQKDPKKPLPCEVKLVGDMFNIPAFIAAFQKFKDAIPAPAPKPSNVISIGSHPDMNSELWGGLPEGKPTKAQDMIDQCPLYAEAVETGGANHLEPLWRGLLKTLVYADDGVDFIHKISEGHPDYNAKRTQKKFDQALRTKADNGPYLCQTFAKHSNVCQTCPYSGKVNTPIKLAYGPMSLLPYPWRDGTYGVERYDPEEDSWEMTIPYRITDVEAACDPGNTTFIKFNMGGTVINTDLNHFVDDRSLFGVLAAYNKTINQPNSQEMRRLMNAWLKQLAESKQVHTMVKELGWTKDGFNYGGKIYDKNGDNSPAFIFDKVFHETYSPHGDIEPWRKCANHILSQPRHAVWCILAAAFGSPLITFTGSTGSILSVVSRDTGTGKSTAMKIAQAVWSQPKKGMISLDATDNAVAHRMGVLNNLPSLWDEVREKEEVQKFIKTIFRVAQGTEKQRLTSAITERESGNWELMMVIASNEAMRDHIDMVGGSSDAGMARVFEIYAEAINDNTMDDATARHFYAEAAKNYGNAGDQYAAWLAKNKARASEIVQSIEKKLSIALNTTSDERFWITTMACLIGGASIATALGLCTFDVKALKEYLITQFKEMRKIKKAQYEKPKDHSVSLVSRFIHDHKDQTIKSDNIPRKGKRPYRIMRNAIRNPPCVRIATEDKVIRIIYQDFKDWLYEKHGATITHVVKDLEDQGMIKRKASIDAGTDLSAGDRQMCMDFALSIPAFGKTFSGVL